MQKALLQHTLGGYIVTINYNHSTTPSKLQAPNTKIELIFVKLEIRSLGSYWAKIHPL